MHLYTDEGSIDTTANHPFYVIGKGWVAAGDLAVGDEVYNLDGTTSTILGSEIEVLDEPVFVYNLEVEDLHSYFVGCVPVLVHNYKNEDWNHHDKYYNQAEDDNLKTFINELYRPDAHVGDGGTADKLRQEFSSGEPLQHLQKAQDRIRELNKRLNNPNLSESDHKLIYFFLNDLYDAVKTVTK